MKIAKGIKLLSETQGEGEIAKPADRVSYNCRISLNNGDEVRFLENQSDNLKTRELIAAVRLTLIGMKVGGYRKVKASPHLAYGKEGIEGLIPANAVLVIELWLTKVSNNNI
ncbi:MAG: FKBP-type peptidyl-prolyl cis-trans isomerase [Thermodesulfobacteriota bacterium]